MKNRNILLIAAAFLLLTFANSCKKDEIDDDIDNGIDLDLLRSVTWELYEVVLRSIQTGEEFNYNDVYLNEECDTTRYTFNEDGTCEKRNCHSKTYNYSYDKTENIITINNEDGTNMHYYRVDELTADKLKVVYMHYDNGDTAEEGGMAEYYRPE